MAAWDQRCQAATQALMNTFLGYPSYQDQPWGKGKGYGKGKGKGQWNEFTKGAKGGEKGNHTGEEMGGERGKAKLRKSANVADDTGI